MNYQKVIVAGNATGDARRQTSRKGDVAFTTFDVAVSDAKGQTTFFPVTVFGKQGEAVARYVTKGRQVLVEGRITVNDQKRFSVVADRVEFGSEPKPAEARPAEESAG